MKATKKESILTDDFEHCFICGILCRPHMHHIFGGPLRNISTKNGFLVPLCYRHHNDPSCHEAVHFNADIANWLKGEAQREFEKTHSHEEFMKIIGRNYL